MKLLLFVALASVCLAKIEAMALLEDEEVTSTLEFVHGIANGADCECTDKYCGCSPSDDHSLGSLNFSRSGLEDVMVSIYVGDSQTTVIAPQVIDKGHPKPFCLPILPGFKFCVEIYNVDVNYALIFPKILKFCVRMQMSILGKSKFRVKLGCFPIPF